MKAFLRSAAWATPLALAIPVIACSGAADKESTASVASALDPSGVIPPTNYILSMWVQVNDVREPTAGPPSDPPTTAGTCWNALGSCQSFCSSYSCWTTDEGYQFWGELAAKVGTGNAVASSCMLQTPSDLGGQTWDPLLEEKDINSATVNTCAGSGLQNGGANGAFLGGGPITLSVSVTDPTEPVLLAAVLDNVEQTSAPNVPLSSAGTILGVTGAALQGVGSATQITPVITDVAEAAADASGVGAVLGVLGSAASILGLVSPSGGNSTPGQHETCAGGAFSRGDGTAGDTLLMSLQAGQLAIAAQNGIELQFHSNGSWAPTSDGNDHCSSNLTLHVTVTRDWGSGLAAAPRAGDFAIASTPFQNNVFFVPQTLAPGADVVDQFIGYAGSTSWSAAMPTDGHPLGNSWDEGVVDANSTGAIAQTSEAAANGNDEYFFWGDNTGTLHMYPFNHTATSIPFADWTLFNQTYTHRVCFNSGGRVTCGPSTTENLLPPDAHVTAVSRAAKNLDAFFVDAQGNAWNVYSGDAGATWGSVPITSDGTGVPGSPITAVARTSDTLDVFFLGTTGVHHASWKSGQAWSDGAVAGTQNLVSPGGHLAAVAQTVDDLDVFFVDPNGKLQRVWESFPAQPSLVVSTVSQTQGDGFPGGPIAAVSRQPGIVDVVFRPSNVAAGATWFSMNAGTWTRGQIATGDVAGDISIVAPSSFGLRVFVKNGASNVYTTSWQSNGVPTWSPLQAIETLFSVPGFVQIEGKCMDLTQGYTTNGTHVQMWDCVGGTHQQWVTGSDGTIRYAAQPDKCLDLTAGNESNGTQLQIWDCDGATGGAHQHWSFTNGALVGPGGKCADDPYFNTTNGTVLDYWDCNGGASQQFSFHTLPVLETN